MSEGGGGRFGWDVPVLSRVLVCHPLHYISI